jgi:hypothetical protein
MKNTVRPAKPDIGTPRTDSDPLSVLSRLKLALLDEYKCERLGYDPYDTSRGRSPDVWTAKRKRA